MYGDKEQLKKTLLDQVLSENIDKLTIDDENNELKSDHLLHDLMNSCFDFSYNEGLNHHQLNYFVRFYHDLIKDTAMKELPVIEAAAMIKDRTNALVSSNMFKQPFLMSSVEFISSSLLQHYHLIVFALCYSRQQQIHLHDVLLETAPYEVDSLKDGKQIDQWKLEDDLETQEKCFIEEEKILCKTMKETIANLEKELEDYFASLSDLQEVNVDLIADIIQNIIGKRGEITSAGVEYAMERSKALMVKNMEVITIHNNFKDSQKNQQTVPQKHNKPPSPNKRAPTVSPGKKQKK